MKNKILRPFYHFSIMCIICVMLCSCSTGDKQMVEQVRPEATVSESEATSAEVLASWNETSSNKKEIIAFVEQVTDENNDNFVPEEERIATFDMDGTIVAEKDLWLELAVAVYRIDTELSDNKTLVKEKDKLLENIKKDPEPPETGKMIVDVTGKAFEGMAQEDFVTYMSEFMQQKKEDYVDLTYADSFYKPMLELIQYLQDNGFTVYLVSGSERGVVWGAAKDILDLPRSQMIGADMALIADSKDSTSGGKGHSMFEPGDELQRGLGFTQKNVENDKVYNIFHQIGIRPILACGNTSGDFSMLNYAKSNPEHPGFALLINHNDKDREYQYNTKERKDWDKKAEKYDWNVVSMKDEFDVIYLTDAEKK